MVNMDELREVAGVVENNILEGIAAGNIDPNYTIELKPDDATVDAYYMLKYSIKFVRLDFTLKKSL